MFRRKKATPVGGEVQAGQQVLPSVDMGPVVQRPADPGTIASTPRPAPEKWKVDGPVYLNGRKVGIVKSIDFERLQMQFEALMDRGEGEEVGCLLTVDLTKTNVLPVPA